MFTINSKFIPYMKECDSSKESEVLIDVLETECDYIYDVMFTISNFTINKKGEKAKKPCFVKFVIRVLEL